MRLFTKMGNRFVWLFTGYAVRPLRIFAAIVFILLIGTSISQPAYAVEPGQDYQQFKEETPDLLKYVLPDDYSDEEREKNPIDAKDIVEALKSGKDVEIRNAVIKGDFILESMVIEGKVTIEQTKFKGPVDCSYATFKKVLRLNGSTFENDVTFIAAAVEKDVFLNDATFMGSAIFRDLTVTGVFNCQFATFNTGGNFNGSTFKKSIFLHESTFEGEAKFLSARIGGQANFTGAEFKQKADFNSAKIEGAAFFKRATFEGEVDFIGARIGANAEFTGAVFKQKANFNRAQIEGAAFFKRATFEGEANFGSTRIGSAAEFTGAVFKREANFDSAKIEGAAFFKQATFEGEADFTGARIGSDAMFTGAVFEQEVSFNHAQIEGGAFFRPTTFEGEADFISARFGDNAEFTDAQFKEKATFYAAQFKTDTHFGGETVFGKDVSFQNTSFRTCFFEGPLSATESKKSAKTTRTKFQKKIDLRGCTYERIYPHDIWKELMKKLKPYDRQPFTQMEETFRKAGEDRLANEVYYERKIREAAHINIQEQPFAWVLNYLHWWFIGYGVQIWRLLVIFGYILMTGILIFRLEGAIEPKWDTPPTPVVPSHANSARSFLRSWCYGFWFSVNLFLPVEIPFVREWKASSKTLGGVSFSTIASILKLAGWVLVPVLVAVLTGRLKF